MQPARPGTQAEANRRADGIEGGGPGRPDPAVDKIERWRLVDLRQCVKERWDVSYSQTGMLRLLWSLDLGRTAMSGGSAGIPRAGCAISAISRLGSSGPYAGTRHWCRLGDDPGRHRRDELLPCRTRTSRRARRAWHCADGQGGLAYRRRSRRARKPQPGFLLPYSPELNPIERLWLHLRDNRLSHCVFQTTGEIVDTCCNAWNWLLGQTGCIGSLCSHPWVEQVSN
jgi:hypothetical protein